MNKDSVLQFSIASRNEAFHGVLDTRFDLSGLAGARREGNDERESKTFDSSSNDKAI